MKRMLGYVLACCLGAICPARADWDVESDFRIDAVARRETVADAKAPTADDHLVALARASDVNIFADATPGEGIEAGGHVVPEARTGEHKASTGKMQLAVALMRFVRAQKLHMGRRGERTFLLWRPPSDAVAVARQVIAEVSALRQGATRSSDEEVLSLLNYFLRQ